MSSEASLRPAIILRHSLSPTDRMKDIAIRVRGLTKSYSIRQEAKRLAESTLAETVLKRLRNPLGTNSETETFHALKDVSFDVKKGDVVGIIGRNGAGKSTLLKILSRITGPTTGRIELYGRIGSLLEVGTGFHPELTGRENIYLNGNILGMSRAEIRNQFDAIVDFAGVEQFLDTPVKHYSSGMYVRLAFAVAAHLESDILIVDEVLAVGDAEFQRKCLGKMKDVASGGRTVLFVSHNMAAVKELCNSGILLAGGRLQLVGGVDSAIRAYLERGTADDFHPERGPLTKVRVTQEESAIVVTGDWQHSENLRLPSLGFVISDYMGSPIVGVNPYLAGVQSATEDSASGQVVARLTEPRLLDGRYYLSVWFGDGAQDFVELPKCISFNVRGMAGARQHAQPHIVGPVAPTCEYRFVQR
jgi:lipopolysaccharide transport system ATP-binding protein